MPRRNRVDQVLPVKLREQLTRILEDEQHGGYRVLSAWLEQQGYRISPDSLRRHDARLVSSIDRIRACVAIARAIADEAPDDEDQQAAAVSRIIQSDLFAAIAILAQMPVDEQSTDAIADRVRVLAMAARASADASRTHITQRRWQDEARARIDEIEREEQRRGGSLDAMTLRKIREGLYGV